MTLFVAYVPRTGHVVGAVNAIDATPPAGAAALVGEALPMRISLSTGETAVIPLESGALDTHAADDEPAALTEPLTFGVEGSPDPKPALVELTSWSGGLSFGDGTLTVMLPRQVSVNTEVLAFVSDEGGTLRDSATMLVGARAVDLAIDVAPDSTHGVLVLVAGWVGRFEEVTA